MFPRERPKVPLPSLSVRGNVITSPIDVFETLASSLLSTSTSARYEPTFLQIKNNAEKTQLTFKSQGKEVYKAPVSVDELL
jgi:hypothetical protein